MTKKLEPGGILPFDNQGTCNVFLENCDVLCSTYHSSNSGQPYNASGIHGITAYANEVRANLIDGSVHLLTSHHTFNSNMCE